MGKELKNTKSVCETCGSDDVESKAWFNHKNKTIEFIDTTDIEDNWCGSCQEHCYIIQEED